MSGVVNVGGGECRGGECRTIFLSPSLLVKRTGFLPQEPNLRHSSRMSKNTIRRGP